MCLIIIKNRTGVGGRKTPNVGDLISEYGHFFRFEVKMVIGLP